MSAPLISTEAVQTLQWIRKGVRPPVRTFFLLTSQGIVIRPLELRFTSPVALGLVRVEKDGKSYRPRIFDPFVGQELARVRLWVEPQNVVHVDEWLHLYRRPKEKLQLFEVEPKRYEKDRPRVRLFRVSSKLDVASMTDDEKTAWYDEIVSNVNKSIYRLHLGFLDPGRFDGLKDVPDAVIVADYPDRPRTAYDLENMIAYGFNADVGAFDVMQFNQTASIVLGLIVSENPTKFRAERVSIALTPDEEAVLSQMVMEKAAGVR